MMNSALRTVPEEAQLRALVERNWSDIRRDIMNGKPVDFKISSIDQYIDKRISDINARIFDMSFDWSADVDAAKWLHQWNKQWMPVEMRFRQDREALWDRLISRMEEFSEKIALSGINLIFVAHGAVALGALKILTEQDTARMHIISISKYALILSIAGLISFVVGKFLIYYFITHFSGRIRSKMIGSISGQWYLAFHRYLFKYNPYIKVGDNFIYFSILLFIINISICGIIL